MAERWAVATGNWSATGTWNGGTLPTSSDDVYSNNFTVTIDQDVTVLSIRNTAGTTAVAGGGFTCSSTRTISANVIAGAVACLTLSGTSVTCTHSGTVQGGTAANAHGISVTGTSQTLNHTSGTTTGGSNATAHGINFVAGLTVDQTHVGNITGGTAGNGVNFAGIATAFNVTGDVISGSSGTGIGTTSGTWTGTATITVTGNVIGTGTGTGIIINGSQNTNVVINGKASAAQGSGVSYSGTGNLTINNVGATAVEGCTHASGSADHGVTGSGGSSTWTINGNVVGAALGSNCNAIQVSSTLLGLTINGNVTGGAASSAQGLNIGGALITNGVVVNGTVKGGTGASSFGINLTGTQSVVCTAVKGNDYGNGTVANQCPGISSTSDNGNVRAKQILFGDYGMAPVIGRIRLIDDVPNDLVQVPRYSDNVIISFRQTSYSADFPALANVRSGTVFDNGAKTGTCAVPAAASVAYGVPVDATTGTAVLTQADVRGAVGMSSANLDSQLSTIAGYVDTEVTANGIRTALGMTTANMDVQLGTIAGYVDTVEAFLATITGYIDTEVAAIKAKTDLIPAAPAAVSDCITAAGVRGALGMSAANLDATLSGITGYVDTVEATLATVSSSLSTVAGYTDTVEASLAAIAAKTVNLPTVPASQDDCVAAAALAAGEMVKYNLGGSDSGLPLMSPWNMLRHVNNKWTITGISGTTGTLTVYKEDGVTAAYTRTITFDDQGRIVGQGAIQAA